MSEKFNFLYFVLKEANKIIIPLIYNIRKKNGLVLDVSSEHTKYWHILGKCLSQTSPSKWTHLQSYNSLNFQQEFGDPALPEG